MFRKAKAQREKAKAETFSKELVVKDLLRQARALNIPAASAESYINAVAEKVDAWVKARGRVTESDINAIVAKEIKKYNEDLSFIYENRGKII
ncbi:hypothetical protein IKW75_02630 [Candidatus Saccharibacteria bacterium]|nr:hypothetical protein [Candidatus Saccharibacteria bacterium]